MDSAVGASGEDPIGRLLARRRALEEEHGDGDTGNFLFGWQCENPFAASLLARVEAEGRSLDRVKYAYIEDEARLTTAIHTMHRWFGEPAAEAVFCGAGAMPLLFTFAAWLRSRGVEEVYYLPPIYFSLHYALRLFGLRARAVSARHAFEAGFNINLPDKCCILILSDPIWYAAQPTPTAVLEEVAVWQARTGSTILVDGSFQYMSWEAGTREPSSGLDPALTFRLISPTKSLAVSGYRFAYILLPKVHRPDFGHCYTDIHGSTNVDSLAFAWVAIDEMRARTITQDLVALMRRRHELLMKSGTIVSELQPRRGFFSFARILKGLPPSYLTMGGDYFDQPRFPDHVRINLLSPSIELLLRAGS